MTARARAITPGGAQTLSRRPERFPESAFPAYLSHGKGARVWDVDGREYIDWVAGLASLTLGYAHPVVNDAVRRQLVDGVTFSLPHRREIEVSERFCATVGQEQVRWVKTGSEAAEAAIRTARVATGRDLILTVGYHSWHSWYAALQPTHPGTPDAYRDMAVQVPYNDLDAAEGFLAFHPNEVAAIFVEPALAEPPAEGYLDGLRALCDRTGALLIFDEVVTGFRWHMQGGAGFFGVEPDLQTFGKAIANGFPLGALVGPARLMEHAWPVSGTFGGEAVALAACEAVMGVYESEPVLERLWRNGLVWLNEWIPAHANPDRHLDLAPFEACPALRVRGYPVHPVFRFVDEAGGLLDRLTPHPQAPALMALWLQETAARGLLLHPGGINSMAAMTTADLAQTMTAARAAAGVLGEALAEGRVTARLRGAVPRANVLRAPSVAPGVSQGLDS